MRFDDIFADRLLSKIENKVSSIRYMRHSKHLAEKVLPNLVLDQYGKRDYYNELDKFIKNNDLYRKIVDDINTDIDFEMKGKRRFAETYASRFIEGNKAFEHSREEIEKIFEILYTNANSKLLTLPKHGDLWKHQQFIRIQKADSDYQDEKNLTVVSNIIEDSKTQMMRSITAIPERLSEAENDSPIIKLYIKKIKEIEKIQKSGDFNIAIDDYTALSDEVNGKLANEDRVSVNKIRYTIIQNKALCYSNIGETDKALHLLDTIDDNIYADNSRAYHYIYAAVLVQNSKKERYEDAYSHVIKAYGLDRNNEKTWLLMHQIKYLLSIENADVLLSELESRLQNKVERNECENDIKAEYYLTHGYLLSALGDYDGAYEDYTKAESFGCEKDVIAVNLAVLFYYRSLGSASGTVNLLFLKIDYKYFKKSFEILKEIVLNNTDRIECPPIRIALQYYLSCCGILNLNPNLSPIDKYLSLEWLDYDSKKVIVMFCDEDSLPAEYKTLLNDSDRDIKEINVLIKNNDICKAKSIIINHINSAVDENSRLFYSLLLQICIIDNNPTDYWKYKKEAETKGITEVSTTVMDACAIELSGNLQKAKGIMDTAADNETDISTLQNIYRFYSRNNFLEEREKLVIRIHRLNCEKAIIVPDNELMYRVFIRDLVDSQSYLVAEILDSIPDETISEELYWRLKLYYAESINDLVERVNALNKLFPITKETQLLYSEAYCLMRLGKVQEAYDVINKLPDSNDLSFNLQKWRLKSDICFLAGRIDESYQLAQKMHIETEMMPEEESHRFLLSKALKYGKEDGHAIIIKYKEKHPVVTDWLEILHFPVDDEGRIIDYPDKLKRIIESDKKEPNYLVSNYNTGMLSLNLIAELYNNEFSHLFNISPKIKLIINRGDINEIEYGQSLFKDNIIVDAMALVFLAHFEIIDKLQSFEKVLIPYSSLEYVQTVKVNSIYKTEEEIVYDWILQQKNIEYIPDGYYRENFIDCEEKGTHFFSKAFNSAFNNSQRLRIPFLNVDIVTENYLNLNKGGKFDNDLFVHLVPFCYKYLHDDSDRFCKTISKMAQKCVFVNFNAHILFELVRINGFKNISEVLEPFLSCKSQYDMMSFAKAYYHFLNHLLSENTEAGEEAMFILLRDTIRIWKRGQHYREFSSVDEDSNIRSQRITMYVATMIAAIRSFPEYTKSLRCQEAVKGIMGTF